MKYSIYQLDHHNENVLRDHKLFESWDMLNRTAGFNFNQYQLVWEEETNFDEKLDDITILENLFTKFNINHPKSFYGHSLSVSDVVILDDKMYYCDSFGWKKINE